MSFNFKFLFAQLLILASSSAFSATSLTCNISEDIAAPLEARSVKYNLNVPLTNPDLNARIDLASPNLKLNFSIITFKSKLTSPGEQVIIVSIKDNESGATSSSDGHSSVQSFYDVAAGSLIVQCSVI